MQNNLLKHYKEYTLCKTLAEMDYKWINGVISYISHNKKMIEVFFPSVYLKTSFTQGSKVTITYIMDEYEFWIAGTVSKNVMSMHKQAVIIKIDELKKLQNQRVHERFHVNYIASVETETGESFKASVNDISYSGTLFCSNRSINVGEKVFLEIFIPEKTSICLSGTLVRKIQDRNSYFYGVQFDTPDNINHASLSGLINFLIGLKNQVTLEWKEFNRIKYTIYTLSVLAIFFTIFIVWASKGL